MPVKQVKGISVLSSGQVAVNDSLLASAFSGSPSSLLDQTIDGAASQMENDDQIVSLQP